MEENLNTDTQQFSSLSESGFIPTKFIINNIESQIARVLISFREWLHSYCSSQMIPSPFCGDCSHLFQRVASFLLNDRNLNYAAKRMFSSLSESGFIPTRVSRDPKLEVIEIVLISFREWLHSYFKQKIYSMFLEPRLFSSLSESGFIPTHGCKDHCGRWLRDSSHLFQRVASFLHS